MKAKATQSVIEDAKITQQCTSVQQATQSIVIQAETTQFITVVLKTGADA